MTDRLGVGPDVPKAKCPPDPAGVTGSSLSVRGSRMPALGASFVHAYHRSSVIGGGAPDSKRASLALPGTRRSAASPLVFSEADAKKLESALLATTTHPTSVEKHDQPTTQPPFYSSIFASALSSIPKQHQHPQHHQALAIPNAIKLKGLPIVTPTTEIEDLSSSVSSLSSSTSSTSSSTSCSFSETSPSSIASSSIDSLCFSAKLSEGVESADKYLGAILDSQSPMLSQSAEAFSDGVWQGSIVSDESDGSRTLFVSATESNELREQVVDLLETAEEYECVGIVICLKKSTDNLAPLIHSLLYVGGVVVPPTHPRYAPGSDYILVGLDCA